MRPDPSVLTGFADGLRTGVLPPGVTARDPSEAATRFAVYRNNVAVSLSRALAARFPAIERLVGEAFFAALARAFSEAHRPETPVLSRWGAAFPGYLAAQAPLAPYPYLPDVARIEWARGLAYHAADLAPVAPGALAAAAQDAGRVRLVLHPGLGLVTSRWPAVTIWQANQPGADPAGARGASGPEAAAVLRDLSLTVQVWPLGPGDAAFLGGMLDRLPLLEAAARATAADPRHDPGPLLVRLAGAGVIIETETQE